MIRNDTRRRSYHLVTSGYFCWIRLGKISWSVRSDEHSLASGRHCLRNGTWLTSGDQCGRLPDLFCSSTVAEALVQGTARPTHTMRCMRHTTAFAVALARSITWHAKAWRVTYHENPPRELSSGIRQSDFFISCFVHLLRAARVRINFETLSKGNHSKDWAAPIQGETHEGFGTGKKSRSL